ncbi:hypothetical protein AC249_AIPGENE5136 [Exaiptasia diaphana]|nr:hypothetical protein AC249_AIPGENE5136 [Exaiptasia diaphana]
MTGSGSDGESHESTRGARISSGVPNPLANEVFAKDKNIIISSSLAYTNMSFHDRKDEFITVKIYRDLNSRRNRVE